MKMEKVKSIIINFIANEKFFFYYDDELDFQIFGKEEVNADEFEEALKEVMNEKKWNFYQAYDYSSRNSDDYSGIYAETEEDAVQGYKEICITFMSKEYAEYLLKEGYYESIYEDCDGTWTGELSENWEEFDPDENENILTYDEFIKKFGTDYVR